MDLTILSAEFEQLKWACLCVNSNNHIRQKFSPYPTPVRVIMNYLILALHCSRSGWRNWSKDGLVCLSPHIQQTTGVRFVFGLGGHWVRVLPSPHYTHGTQQNQSLARGQPTLPVGYYCELAKTSLGTVLITHLGQNTDCTHDKLLRHTYPAHARGDGNYAGLLRLH